MSDQSSAERDDTPDTPEKKCPHCGAIDVRFTGASHGFGTIAPGGALPETTHFLFECRKCSKLFHYVGKM